MGGRKENSLRSAVRLVGIALEKMRGAAQGLDIPKCTKYHEDKPNRIGLFPNASITEDTCVHAHTAARDSPVKGHPNFIKLWDFIQAGIQQCRVKFKPHAAMQR